jgi:phenylalanyl-tRNA synthetase alpha chain
MSLEESENYSRAKAIHEAFEQKFKRFERFLNTDGALRGKLDDLTLAGARELVRELAELRTWLVGRNSAWNGLKKLVGQLAPESRREFAQRLQQIEAASTGRLEAAEQTLSAYIDALQIERERIDVTIPGRRPRQGHLHPITLLRQRIEEIFVALGYAIEDDREVETDYYNFDALNIPVGHPARASQDTFYTTEGFALRSQTSTIQIRALERRGAPLRVIAPGRVFRRDTPDPTHVPMFHQVEGLCVEQGITMAHLKGTMAEFVHRLFGPATRTRMRPSYFPFTEPSAEFDYSCFMCGGTGRLADDRCRTCKGSGWIELGGSGMVHPNVLSGCGVDPEKYTGFAFGLGLERMCALLYTLDDIRLMFENDVRFLRQFA